MLMRALGIEAAGTNPWNKGRKFGLSHGKFLMTILIHET